MTAKTSGGNGASKPPERVQQPKELITCPSCEGKKPAEGEEVCTRCGGRGKTLKDPEPTNVVRLPPKATIIPKDTAKQARREFKLWKRTFVDMINRGSNIEWRRTPDGKFHYKFILPAELFKIVYEIQINERIRAQLEHAAKICKEKGIALPTKQELERIALANLQQEFMAHTMQTMKALQQPTKDAATKAKKQEPKKEPTADEEEEAAAKLRDLRAQLVQSANKADEAGEKIREELARRKSEEGESEKS